MKKTDTQHRIDFWVAQGLTKKSATEYVITHKAQTMLEASYLLNQRWKELITAIKEVFKK